MAEMEWPKITLFGDSITRRSTDPDNGCWGSFINYKVNEYFDVEPRGFEGYNSKWALELMPKLFPKSYLDKVEIFIIFFGHNDSWEPDSAQHVPVASYEANMRAIINYLVENGLERRKIILVTPSWCHVDSWLEFRRSRNESAKKKEFDEAKKYSDVILRLANDESIDVVDYFGFSANFTPLNELFCDGLHFSRLGARKLSELLMPVIEKKIESKYGKPLAELWHVVPWDQHPDVVKHGQS